MGWLGKLVEKAVSAITHFAGTVREWLGLGYDIKSTAEGLAKMIEEPVPGPPGMTTNYQYVLEYDLVNPKTNERWPEYRSIPTNKPITWEEAVLMGYDVMAKSEPATDYAIKDIHPSKRLINPKLLEKKSESPTS